MERMGVDVIESLKERTARLLSTECVGRGAWHDLVTALEAEVSRLQAEKAEVERDKRALKSALMVQCDRANAADDRATAAESALLQAREDALEEAAKVCEKRAENRWEEHGYTEPDTNASYYPNGSEWCETADEEVGDCAKAIRALKSARQAEPQEGEKG